MANVRLKTSETPGSWYAVWRYVAERWARSSSAAFLISVSAFAASTAVTAEETLDCAFETGIVRTLNGDAFVETSATALRFGIANVDMQKQSAEVVTGTGRGQLRVVRAVDAIHYLEVVSEGFMNMTTVYGTDGDGERLPAVHSRHIALIGQPVVAQYTGVCVRKTP